MENLLPKASCLSRLLAATLLDAWLSGDRYRLAWELERMSVMPQIPADGAEWDRMEILTSIAREMKTHSDLFAPRSVNARIGVWVNLLAHFSGSEQRIPS